ncbi:hypothetical protein Tco_1247223 [Tanacetum coccineum]
MSTYLKNMAGYKHNQLKNKSFDDIQKLFDKAMKRVNTFVDIDTELVEGSGVRAEGSDTRVEGSSKRAGEEADGNSQMYLTFGKMLKNINREDLEVLWSIVKARFKKTEPVNYMDNFLLLNLKTMFEHHVEENNILYYLLVEKMYLLTNHTLHQMFNDVKLQVDYECKMAFELLRLVKKQLKEGYGRIVGIKSLHDDLEFTAAKVCVTAAKLKIVLFINSKEKYAK